MMSIQRLTTIAALVNIFVVAAFPLNAYAALRTIEFEGAIGSSNSSPIVNEGDIFTGHYTFETSVTPIPHPDATLDIQAVAINDTLTGTGWALNVNSTAVAPFVVTGTGGVISVGNNTGVFGDRYIATLDSASNLPLGEQLNFFQIDLQDRIADGADMLIDDLFTSLPDISLADESTGGRFFTLDVGSGERQIPIIVTSLTLVPEPSAWCLLLMGVASIGAKWRYLRR